MWFKIVFHFLYTWAIVRYLQSIILSHVKVYMVLVDLQAKVAVGDLPLSDFGYITYHRPCYNTGQI